MLFVVESEVWFWLTRKLVSVQNRAKSHAQRECRFVSTTSLCRGLDACGLCLQLLARASLIPALCRAWTQGQPHYRLRFDSFPNSVREYSWCFLIVVIFFVYELLFLAFFSHRVANIAFFITFFTEQSVPIGQHAASVLAHWHHSPPTQLSLPHVYTGFLPPERR